MPNRHAKKGELTLEQIDKAAERMKEFAIKPVMIDGKPYYLRYVPVEKAVEDGA